jgi:hypothetical protein
VNHATALSIMRQSCWSCNSAVADVTVLLTWCDSAVADVTVLSTWCDSAVVDVTLLSTQCNSTADCVTVLSHDLELWCAINNKVVQRTVLSLNWQWGCSNCVSWLPFVQAYKTGLFLHTKTHSNDPY